MRFSRLAILCLGIGAVVGCRASDVSDPTLPAIGGVRFINAVADTGAVDIRMIDQVEFSAVGNAMTFRTGTEHQPTEAKARHLRVFPTSTNPAITSNYLLDTTITITANSRQTLLLVGSARTKSTLKFVVINDNPTTPAAGQIGVRVVNASSGAINGYVVADTTVAIADPATAANVGAIGASAYVLRPMGSAALRVTDVGSTKVNVSAPGPVAAAPLSGELPAAGVNSEKTVFSVYYFPRSVAGSTAPQSAAFLVPGLVWFVDHNPADK